jgi:hypothetical protein
MTPLPRNPQGPSRKPKAAQPIHVASEVTALKLRVEQHNLLLQTLLRLLVGKGVIGKEEFQRLLQQVDELDGARDGRLHIEKGTKSCPACGRVSNLKAIECQYCGAAFPPPDFISHEAQ